MLILRRYVDDEGIVITLPDGRIINIEVVYSKKNNVKLRFTGSRVNIIKKECL